MFGNIDLRQFLGGGVPGGMGGMIFEETYRCYSVAFCGRPELEQGDKILLPVSALEALTRLHVQYPMQFQLRAYRNESSSTHCGVMEFSSDEGKVYAPHWVMSNLLIQEGEMVTIRNVQLPKGKFVKLRPHSKDFLEISNPRAVLEKKLRHYSCLTVGDVIVFNHAGLNYSLDVLETRPTKAISIVETDVEVDFAPPADYVEPDYKGAAAAAAAAKLAAAASSSPFVAFASSSSSSSSAAAAAGAAASARPSSIGVRGEGTAANPIVFDDEVMDMGGSASFPVPAGVMTASGESSTKRSRAQTPQMMPGGSSSSASAAASAETDATQQRAAMAAAATARMSSSTPKVQPFTGAGRRLNEGPSSAPPSSSPSLTGAVGKPPGSPSLHPLAGGVVLSGVGAGAAAAPKPQRSLNRFEQARLDKSFAGQGRTLK